MNTPEDFHVGFPRPFEMKVGPGDVDHRGSEWPAGVWVDVEGGGLPVPLVVRIDQAADGRFLITGMMIGRAERREVTWETLRTIKPASILQMIFAGWDPQLPEKILQDSVELSMKLPPRTEALQDEIAVAHYRFSEGDTTAYDTLSPEGREYWIASQAVTRALNAQMIWKMTGGSRPDSEVTEVTRPRASVATNLTEFADAYKRNYAADPRRATTATARELHISRATAIRRIAECREIGLIPPKEQDRE